MNQNVNDLLNGLSLEQVNNVVLIGNPGVGKSHLLNLLTRNNHFKSGLNVGFGLTQVLQSIRVGGVTFHDTPGLDDVSIMEKAAQEITKVLQWGGVFKIIFVMTLEAGRIRGIDMNTIKIVTNSIKMDDLNYSIIINKVPEQLIDDENLLVFREILNRNPKPVSYLNVLPDQKEFNNDPEFILMLKEIVMLTPKTKIKKETVKDLEIQRLYSGLKEMKEMMDQHLIRHTKQLEHLKERIQRMPKDQGTLYKVGKGKKVHKKTCWVIQANDNSAKPTRDYSLDQLCSFCC